MRLSLFLFVCALFSSNALRATTVIYSNYNASNPPASPVNGLNVVNADAIPFTEGLTPDLGFNFALNDVNFLFATSDNLETNVSAGAITVSLYDNAGGLPGNLLGSSTGFLSDTSTQADVQFSNGPVLQQGHQYWIGLSDSITSDLEWFTDGVPNAGVATLDSFSNWGFVEGYTQGTVQINAVEVPITSTPEPPTLLALGTGLLIVLRKRR